MQHMTRVLAALVFLVWAATATAQMVLEVIPLRHRTVEEIIPILQPMMARDASLTGTRGQLIVRTTPGNLEEVKRILATIDAPARRLQITVAQAVAGDAQRRGAEISGTMRSGDAAVTIPGTGPAPRDGVAARIYDSRTAENVRVMQTVHVLEGRSAYVQTGQSVPLSDRVVTRSVVGGRVVEQYQDSAYYRNLDTGFYVTPRLSGDTVTLDISTQRDVPARRPGAVDVQRVGATVSGRLGEWIEVAAVSEERTGDRSVLLGRSAGAQSENRSVLLKVDELR